MLSINELFITSPKPDLNSFSLKVLNLDDIKTTPLVVKAPTKFLPSGILIAVLPPTDESTWDRSVVGI